MREFVKAREIAQDYIKNHLWKRESYLFGDHKYIIILDQSIDITGGIVVELYDASNVELIDALTETKETLADGISYMMAQVDFGGDMVAEHNLDINLVFTEDKDMVKISVTEPESGEIKVWDFYKTEGAEMVDALCNVGYEIYGWIQLWKEM